jgi:hypothetical protein
MTFISSPRKGRYAPTPNRGAHRTMTSLQDEIVADDAGYGRAQTKKWKIGWR